MVVGCQSNCVMLYNYVYWAEESSILGLSVIDVRLTYLSNHFEVFKTWMQIKREEIDSEK